MELSSGKNLVITNDALKYAKIIAAPIENDVQRKRAFASIVALDALADYLVTQDITVSITKNLFKIAPVNEEFEISDVYYNGWKLDVRLVVNDEFVSVPKSHFKFDILADMYIAIKVDSKLENAELVGFIDGSKVSKTIDSGAYYLMNVDNLSPVEDLITVLQTPKETESKFTDHSAFSSLYLAYLDNDIDSMGKKSFIKHVSACADCRSDLVEFYDFEAIVKNSALCPEIFEDHTLSIVGGQVIDQEKYAGKEELIPIRDTEEPVSPDNAGDSDGSDNNDILGELFENSQNNLLMEKSDNSLLNTGILAAGVIGAGAVIASATSASAATTSSIEAGAAVIEAGASLISSSAKLLNNNLPSAPSVDFDLEPSESLIEQTTDSDFLAELADLNAENGEFCELSSFDVELVTTESPEIELDVESVVSAIADDEYISVDEMDEISDVITDGSLDDLFSEFSEVSVEDEELIAPLEKASSDILEDDTLSEVEDESENLGLLDDSDAILADELIETLEETNGDVVEDELTDFGLLEESDTLLMDESIEPLEETLGGIVDDELNDFGLLDGSDTLLVDESISSLEEVGDDSSDENTLLSYDDESTELSQADESELLLTEDELKAVDDDFLPLTSDEEEIDDSINTDLNELFDDIEDQPALDAEATQIGMDSYDEFGNDLTADDNEATTLLDSEVGFLGISDKDESTGDEDNFMSFSKQENDFIQDENDYSFESSDQTLSDEELDEFNDFINAGNEMKEEEDAASEGEMESLDNEIQLSYSIESEDIESLEDDSELTFLDDSDEDESSENEFISANPSEIGDDETEADEENSFISGSPQNEDKEKQELKFLYDKNTDIGDEDSDANEQMNYIINKEEGLSIFKDKKMIILASCFAGCLLFGTIFGISAHNNKIKTDKENAELANQQLLEQSGEINQEMGSMTPIPMTDPAQATDPAQTSEVLARGATANVPKDMDKVMTNVFDENPSAVAVTKISWEVPQSIAQNELFSKYLQIAGKNLQLNLKNDLINATEFAYNDKVNVLIVIGKDNKVRKLEILKTSGSEQIDELVLQSIKETLKYINVPQLPDSPIPSQHNLAKENEYNLKLAINF